MNFYGSREGEREEHKREGTNGKGTSSTRAAKTL